MFSSHSFLRRYAMSATRVDSAPAPSLLRKEGSSFSSLSLRSREGGIAERIRGE
jgi:hypothetical protein